MRTAVCASPELDRVVTALGYRFVSQLQYGEFIDLLRVSKGKGTTILKITRDEWPDPQVIQRFYHDFMIGAQLTHPFIATYQQLNICKKHLVISQRDNGGRLLTEWIPPTGMTIDVFFNLALSLVTVVDYLHQQDIVHKSLNPKAFLFNVQSNAIECMDFSDALHLSQPTDEVHNTVLSNLAYTAPECIQSAGQSFDYRADLYSLGVIFYQLLTGKLPFTTQNPVELSQAQVSAVPVAPVVYCAAIPKVINMLILKLLSKNPDDRYPNCRILHMDLRHCYTQWQHQGRISSFELGRNVYEVIPKFKSKLYERDQELAAIQILAKQTQSSEMLLVSGVSGVGKSELVTTAAQLITEQQGYFISGKCAVLPHTYGAINHTFSDLTRQILEQDETCIQAWRTRLQHALGVNGVVMTNIIPDLERLIGPQRPLPKLGPLETEHRFNDVVSRFLTACAQQAQLFILFVDDLQWIDAASMNVLRLFLTTACSNVLIIGAYRSNEVDDKHVLTTTLAQLPDVTTHRITLQPLSEHGLGQWVTDTLHCSKDVSLPLAQWIHKKTAGNPFFVRTFLQVLYQENLLTVNHAGVWIWDLSQIEAAYVTDNVAAVMVTCIKQLPQELQEILKICACLGSEFTVELLAAVMNCSIQVVEGTIVPIVNLGITSCVRRVVRFAHDAVQEAAYQLISEDDKPHYHLRIARALHANLINVDRHISIIVGHFNLGRVCITELKEHLVLAELNYTAAIKAQAAAAYQQASEYLSISKYVLTEYIYDPWSTNYQLTFAVYQVYAQCAYFCGRHEVAETNYQLLLMHAKTRLDKASILHEMAIQYAVRGTVDLVIKTSITGLKLLGVKLPAKPNMLHVLKENFLVKCCLRNKSTTDLLQLPVMYDKHKIMCSKLLMEIVPALYNAGNQQLYIILIILKHIRLSLRYGNNPASAFAYANYGVALVTEFNQIARGSEFSKLAVKLNEQFADPQWRTRVMMIDIFCISHWSKHWSTLTTEFPKVVDSSYESGDLFYRSWSCCGMYAWHPSMNLTTVLKENKKYARIVEETNYQCAIDAMKLQQLFWLNLNGQRCDPCSLSDSGFDELEVLHQWKRGSFTALIAIYHTFKLRLCFIFECYDQAREHINHVEQYYCGITVTPNAVEFHVYAFLVLARYYAQCSVPKESRTIWKKLQGYYKQMHIWATHCPENFSHHLVLFEAELVQLRGDVVTAMDLYAQASQLAQSNGYLSHTALINEQAAKFYATIQQSDVSHSYWQKAHQLYMRWGAAGKARHLAERYLVGEAKQILMLLGN